MAMMSDVAGSARRSVPAGWRASLWRARRGLLAAGGAALLMLGSEAALAGAHATGAQAEAEDGALQVRAVISDTRDWLGYWMAPRASWPDYPARAVLVRGRAARLLIHFKGAGQQDGAFKLDCAIRAASPGADGLLAGDILVAARCADFAPRRAGDVHLARIWLDLAAGPRNAGTHEAFIVEVQDRAAQNAVSLAVAVRYGEKASR